MFKEYLINQKSESYLVKAKQKIQFITQNHNIDVLSFNYTLSNEDDYIDTLNIDTWINIHGYLGKLANGRQQYAYNLPIIGIDSSGVKDISDFKYPFTKIYRTLIQRTTFNQKLPSYVDRIVFYGHSLSFSDYSYFEALFDMYDLYNSNITLKFYYATYDVCGLYDDRSQVIKENLKIQQGVVENIMHLIIHYGSTLRDNHGNNLYSKLVLEGRIIIEEDKGSRGKMPKK